VRLSFALIALVACGSPGDPPARAPSCPATLGGGFVDLDVAGAHRTVYVRVPAGGGPHALLLAWHGGGGDPVATLERIGHLGDTVAIAPLAIDPSRLPAWDDLHGEDSPDLALFDVLVRCAVEQLHVDPDRVTSTGMSAGGFFTAELLRVRADVLAGGAVFSGGMRQAWSPTSAHPPVAITFGGAADTSLGAAADGSVTTWSYAAAAEQMTAAFRANGQQVLLCDHGGGHVFPDDGGDVVRNFLLRQRRGVPSPVVDAAGLPAYCQLAP
jgi:poly(3-hydroxybutyrate) depolymerase